MMQRNVNSAPWEIDQTEYLLRQKIQIANIAMVEGKREEARTLFQAVFDVPGFNATHPQYRVFQERVSQI